MKTTYQIGDSLKVKRIGFGSMRLTSGHGKWGPPMSEKHAINVLKESIEIGYDFIDTADMYGPGHSERIIAKALWPYPSNLVIATKGGNEITGPDKVKANCSPKYLRKCVHDSLKRLKADSIDLYQLHTVDSQVDIEYSIEELVNLKDEGKIKNIGVSNIDMKNLLRAIKVGPITSVQNRFNQEDVSNQEIIDLANGLNIAFISYYPLAKGVLAKHKTLSLGEGKELVTRSISLAQENLLWQLNKSKNIIPIPGTSSIAHLKENFETLNYLNT